MTKQHQNQLKNHVRRYLGIHRAATVLLLANAEFSTAYEAVTVEVMGYKTVEQFSINVVIGDNRVIAAYMFIEGKRIDIIEANRSVKSYK